MFAPAINGIARRVVFDDLDVRDQSRPGKRPLNHVVAQQGSLGKPGIHETMEGVDIVNSLAHEAAFAKEILVCIGNSAGINVEGCIRREDSCEPRLPGRLQVYARLRL